MSLYRILFLLLLIIVFFVAGFFVSTTWQKSTADISKESQEPIEQVVAIPAPEPEPPVIERTDLSPDKMAIPYEGARVIEKWNRIALEVIAGTRTNPPEASRFLAMMHIAMFEAVNSIEQNYEPYDAYLPVESTETYNKQTVLASAAKALLDYSYPQFSALTDAEIAQEDTSSEASLALGIAGAESIIALRTKDGSEGNADYEIRDEIGAWKATPPYYESPLLPHWGSVSTFVTASEGIYPEPPTETTSPEYAEEFSEVFSYGGVDSEIRTDDQSEIAKFWADGKGTYTPPGHWNVIAGKVMRENRLLSIEEEARCFALLNIAMADAGIQTWKAKFDFQYWRPIDAIRRAQEDDNTLTAHSEEWFNYIETPNFPEYPSGHSTFSGAGSQILEELLGENVAFTSHSLGLPGVERSFNSFDEAAEEAGMSRIYGGIHFQKANTEGLRVGREIGSYVATNLLNKK